MNDILRIISTISIMFFFYTCGEVSTNKRKKINKDKATVSKNGSDSTATNSTDEKPAGECENTALQIIDLILCDYECMRSS